MKFLVQIVVNTWKNSGEKLKMVSFLIPNTQLNISSHHWCTRLKNIAAAISNFSGKTFLKKRSGSRPLHSTVLHVHFLAQNC